MSTMPERPVVEVEATFLPAEEGGRKTMPNLATGRYMPHLVVQSPEIRVALTVGNQSVEDYLGVAFIIDPEPVIAGRSRRFLVELMYHPRVNYDSLEPGAGFTIREGSKVVGYGVVVRRS